MFTIISRPPPGLADSSISPVVICLSTAASPEDWRWRAGDVAKVEVDSGLFQIVMA